MPGPYMSLHSGRAMPGPYMSLHSGRAWPGPYEILTNVIANAATMTATPLITTVIPVRRARFTVPKTR